MNKNPVILIDDDKDDRELFEQAFSELNLENELIIFDDGLKFYDFIRTTDIKTFFILCDMNMNKIGGLELKKMIFEEDRLRIKCIPFLMMSSGKASPRIEEAYSLNVQGYFMKPNSFEGIKEILRAMCTYWDFASHPNK